MFYDRTTVEKGDVYDGLRLRTHQCDTLLYRFNQPQLYICPKIEQFAIADSIKTRKIT